MKHKSMSQINKEKGRKWDGKSRPSTELYKKRWNEIFGRRNEVITEASFTSRDYSNENTNNPTPNNKRTGTDKVPDKKESNV